MERQLTPEEQSLIEQTHLELKEMDKQGAIPILIPPYGIYALIGNLQLALRHPANQGPSRAIVEDIARQMQSCFPRVSAAYQILEKGWQPEDDIEIEVLNPDNELGRES